MTNDNLPNNEELEQFNKDRLSKAMEELALEPAQADLTPEELKEFGLEVDPNDHVAM